MRKILLISLLILLFMVITGVGLYTYYIRPVDNNKIMKIVEIEKNSSSKQIAKVLKKNNLIKNDTFFLIYLKLNNIVGLQAGTYKLNTSMTLKEIVNIIKSGNIYTDDTIRITFREGINYREFARVVEKNTNNTYDDVLNVLNDKDYLNSLIEDYWFLTDKILDDRIYYPLEGYLFPDTYEFKNIDVTVEEIIKKLLDQMDKVLSPYSSKIEVDKFNVHEILTLASIVEKETSNNEEYRKKVASVLENRLKSNMSLGCDVTTYYALKIDNAAKYIEEKCGGKNCINYQTISPYNTRLLNGTMNGKLPVGPISMVSAGSIEAVLSHTESDYTYFISNIKTGEMFFYNNKGDFNKKNEELKSVNGGL